MTEQIKNGNVYLDGVNYLGKIKEVQLPELKQKMTESPTLGMFGTKKLPNGLEALESKIKWSSWLPEIMKKAANPYKQADLTFYGNYEIFGNTGLEAEKPVKCFMKGTFENIPLGTSQPNQGMEVETTLSVSYIKLVVDGEELFEVDVDNNIYIVGGVDLMKQFRVNLGIA